MKPTLEEQVNALRKFLEVEFAFRKNGWVALQPRCSNCLSCDKCEKEERVFRMACSEWK